MVTMVEREMSARLPILVILGATGTGKSKLAIQLAKRFSGEIISADSMQVYKGLDIITNKVTEAEQDNVPHHLLNFLDPLKEYTVVDFRNEALPTIDQIHNRKRLPIIVGGTNYYIESILWNILIEDIKVNDSAEDEGAPSSKKKKFRLADDEEKSNEELYQLLADVDPDMASRLHPNNRRKVLRSLEVLISHGKKLSELLTEQKQMDGGNILGGPLRYADTLMLWIQCNQSVLDKRLDKRVDDMIENGLVEELLNFNEEYNRKRLLENKTADYTRGIFQSIGFKEFHEYLIMDPDLRATEEGQALFRKGVEDLKMVTRRYARKQIKWVRNRFLRRPDRQVPRVFGLDATDLDKWDSEVYRKAEDIVDRYLKGESPALEPLPLEYNYLLDHVSYKCEDCDRVFIGTVQWEIHRKSKKHQKVLNRLARDKKNIVA